MADDWLKDKGVVRGRRVWWFWFDVWWLIVSAALRPSWLGPKHWRGRVIGKIMVKWGQFKSRCGKDMRTVYDVCCTYSVLGSLCSSVDTLLVLEIGILLEVTAEANI